MTPVLTIALSRTRPLGPTALLTALLILLAGCASTPDGDIPPFEANVQLMEEASLTAGNSRYIEQLYRSRTWWPYSAFEEDPIEIGKSIDIPIQDADVRLLGPDDEDALRSLALKIWMIENARHTVDAVYYIFSSDLVGQALLGAMCNAVKRGVDVRVMVDALGSFALFPAHLRALASCAADAANMRTADGTVTPYPARAQVLKFNAVTRGPTRINRRSHDKLLVIDGAFPDRALVLTGGRNVSLDYYGLNADGDPNLDTYRDLEIVLRPTRDDTFGDPTVGDVSETYASLLFLSQGNLRLEPVDFGRQRGNEEFSQDPYRRQREQAQASLVRLKSFAPIQAMLADMDDYLDEDFETASVRLAHELANLTDRRVTLQTQENIRANPNSVTAILAYLDEEDLENSTVRVVSPYLFVPQYFDRSGEVVEDGAESALAWLAQDPSHRIEIITNSVLTSDNIMAQSVIDMDLGPRLLLPEGLRQAWLAGLKKGELDPDLVESPAWQQAINHPQIDFYQTGRLDAAKLGEGDVHYGKLHAKFIVGDRLAFVGTHNFDYRSRLYNNEMGFFYENPAVRQDLVDIFDELKARSYRWGSPEWLALRQAVRDRGGMKGWGTRNQRPVYKFLKATGLIWWI